jgi:hypothetical protein
VASVLEDLVRDVEALWFCRGGPDDVDFDRCDRHAFCDAACFSEWDSIQYLASSILWPCCLVASFGDTRQRCPNTGVNSVSPSAPC